MFQAQIKITLKKTVADPQGLTVKHALDSLNTGGIENVRVGKYIEVKLEAKDKAEAEAKVEEMCEKLLANPIIEDFTFEVNKI